MALSSFFSETCCHKRSVWWTWRGTLPLLRLTAAFKSCPKKRRKKSYFPQRLCKWTWLKFDFSGLLFFLFFFPSLHGHSEILRPGELVTSPTRCNCSNCHVSLTRKSALRRFLAVVHWAPLTRTPSVHLTGCSCEVSSVLLFWWIGVIGRC